MNNIRQAVVAGQFYPADPIELNTMIKALIEAVEVKQQYQPKMIIAPHAGYIYSGAIAASAYAVLQNMSDQIKHVVLLGPAHHYPVAGLAVPSADYYATPLGDVKIDQESIKSILSLPQVQGIDAAFDSEHCLEVQLPFLQYLLTKFSIIPFIVGKANQDNVAEVLDSLWGNKETLIIISSDLSHYHPYVEAKKLDNAASCAITALQPQDLHDDQACGRFPIRGALQIAQKKKLKAKIIDLRNSGDTAGAKDSVVGYGAYHFIPEE